MAVAMRDVKAVAAVDPVRAPGAHKAHAHAWTGMAAHGFPVLWWVLPASARPPAAYGECRDRRPCGALRGQHGRWLASPKTQEDHMAAINVVRFRVKPGQEQEFVDFHRRARPRFKGFEQGWLLKT